MKGIIFKDELVLAIESGRKTQTRRLEDKPRHKVGDRLYVKQAWRSWTSVCDDNGRHELDEYEDPEHDEHCNQIYVAYRANPRIDYRPIPDKARICYLDESTPIESNKELLGPWKSSMFMPEWAARLFIEIVEVRVQSLQEITELDARAEGCRGVRGAVGQTIPGPPLTAREDFIRLWDSINGVRGVSRCWSANPTVTAYTFKVVPR